MAVRCLDLSTGLAGAATVRLLLDSGMVVYRVDQAGDAHFARRVPAYPQMRDGVERVGPDEVDRLIGAVDVVVVGGEPSPEHGTTRPDPRWTAADPRLIVVDLGSTLRDGATPATEGLAQAATGMSFEHYSDRPFWFGVPLASYGQAILAAYGAWGALVQRLRTGAAATVRARLDDGAAYFMAPFWLSAEHPDAEFDKVTPKDVKHLLFPCRDGGYVQFVLGVPSAVQKLYSVLEIDVIADPADRGFPKPGAPAATFFGDRALIEAHTVRLDRQTILERAKRIGLPAAPVLPVGEVWNHPQAAANGLVEEADGRISLTGFVSITLVGRTDAAEPRVTDRPGPLSGYRVLDFGAFVAGPFAGRLMEDLGAEVIKVEPLEGDPGRGTMRHFILCQSGKRSLSVDLKSAIGREVMRRLLASADIVIHNFRSGVDARLGLAPEQIHEVNPKVITLASMAFGAEGPLAAEPGFDMIAQALTGLETRAGGAGAEPVWYRTPYLDYAAGGLGAIALLAAVHDRVDTGRVAATWVSLFNTGLFMVGDCRMRADGGVDVRPVVAADQLGVSAVERHFRTGDGWITVCAVDEAMAGRLVEVVAGATGSTDLSAGLVAGLSSVFRTEPTQAWLRRLAEANIWATRTERPRVPEATRADHKYGTVRGHVRPLVDLGVRAEGERPGAPTRGLHSRAVLIELGYSESDIDDMVAARVVAESAAIAR